MTLGHGWYILVVMNLTDVTTKLKQSLPVFHKENLKDNPKNDILETIEKQRNFTFLRGFVKDIFQTEQNPELSQSDLDFYSEINDFTIKTIKRDDSRHKHVYTESYLPFNIYNDSWLTKYFTKILKGNRREQLKRDKISADIIKQINKQAKSQYPSQDNTMHDKLNAKINAGISREISSS